MTAGGGSSPSPYTAVDPDWAAPFAEIRHWYDRDAAEMDEEEMNALLGQIPHIEEIHAGFLAQQLAKLMTAMMTPR